MEHHTADEARRKRLREVFRLYVSGKTLAQVGALLEPRVTAQRVGQMLTEGAKLGLYDDPRSSRKPPGRISEESVEAETQRFGEARIVARNLRIPLTRLKTQFALAMSRGAAIRRETRRTIARADTIAAYRALVVHLGRRPTSTELRPTALGRRIQRQFGGLRAFLKALAHECPDSRDGAPPS